MNEINFMLTKKDVKAAIKLTGRLRQRMMVSVGHSVLALIGVALVSYRLYYDYTQWLMYVLLAISVGVIAYSWGYLKVELTKILRESVERPATVKFLGTKINFCFVDSDGVVVDVRDKPAILEDENLFVITTGASGMIVLPKKHLDDEQIELLKKNDFGDDVTNDEIVVEELISDNFNDRKPGGESADEAANDDLKEEEGQMNE